MSDKHKPRPVNRVVTGHDPAGQAVVSMRGEVPGMFELSTVPGTWFQEIWQCDSIPALIDNAADPTTGEARLTPPVGGARIRILDIPPDSVQNNITAADAAATFAALGSGEALHQGSETRHALMHRTETLDFGILIEGRLWLLLDKGEVELQPGDVVVQRGTNHAWSNRTTETARIAFVLLDGQYAQGIAPKH